MKLRHTILKGDSKRCLRKLYIVQLNEEFIKGQIKELIRGSVEETLNELLEKEAESRCERNEAHQGCPAAAMTGTLPQTSGATLRSTCRVSV